MLLTGIIKVLSIIFSSGATVFQTDDDDDYN